MLLGFLTLIPMERVDANDEDTAAVRAAFARLNEASSHAFALTTTGNSFVKKLVGKTERSGWAFCTQTSTNGTFDFVFKGRAGVIKTSGGWETFEDMTNPNRASRGLRGGPMRTELMLLKDVKLPATVCLELLDKVDAFRRDGDSYRGEFKREALVGMVKGAEGDPNTTSKATVRVWLLGDKPSKLEVVRNITTLGKTSEFGTTIAFSDVGSTKVEIPKEAKERLER